MSTNEFEVGELVWTKMSRYPWWPAIVVSEDDVSDEVRNAKKKNCTLIRFFADTQFGWMNSKNELIPFRDPKFKEFSKSKNQTVKKALEEALLVEKESGIAPQDEVEEISGNPKTKKKKHNETNKEKKKTTKKKKRKHSKESKKSPNKEESKRKKVKTEEPKHHTEKISKKEKKKEKHKKEKKEKKKKTNATLDDVKTFQQQLIPAMTSQKTEELLQILSKLQNYKISLEILTQTKIGRILKKLSKNTDKKVSDSAHRLMKRYQKVMMKYVNSGGEQLSVTAKKKNEDTDEKATQKTDKNEEQSESTDEKKIDEKKIDEKKIDESTDEKKIDELTDEKMDDFGYSALG